MKRTAGRALLLIAAALLAAGCTQRAKVPVPEAVAVKVARPDMARYRGFATTCGAKSATTKVIGDATLLIVGADSPAAVRDCFFERARADYRAHHPIRAWIEERIG